MTREEAKAVVEKLVNRFAEQRNGYHAAEYNETKTRIDFIDPLFTAFGWDMHNKDDVAEPYREVIHEGKVKIQGKTKAPDYGFRLSGSKDRLFFVEAKKPSVALKTNKESAFQVRRYGWNSGASVSILTNFEEFSIYDCSKKPSSTESSTVARLKYFTYDQLLKEFDFFYDIFSREAVVKGRFDNYIKSDTAKKGTQTPDKEFVVSLDNWRRFIAIDIAKSNLKLTEDELNFAVQLIIDRLIFLRFCEDRGVETYGQLKTSVSKGDAYKNLCGVFKDADNKYNSGLFDFKKDRITQELKVTNKVIKGIVEDLYSPNCEYDFKALPVEVLGNAYEQFLGKVIRINKAHHAVIEEKPEVRKAGGVFYTPQYIVDYIVENTLGKLIKDKTPKQVEKIKIVDPACGSGSFLLGAFQYLLNFHAEYYHKNGYANKKGKDNPLTPHGTLSTAEKKKILLNNVFGIDIDANAVEVTKLSLLLKCMEGETDASIKQQITMFHERVLPDLDNNIKDGNSLVDTDIYDTQIDFGEEKKIKPFSWKKGFPEVFKQGGFDVVIGNPPYVIVFNEEVKKYLETNYPAFQRNNDLYVAFIARCLNLVKPDGVYSMITPNSFIRGDYFNALRLLLNKYQIKEIVDFGNKLIFSSANVFTCIFNIVKAKPKSNWIMKSDLDVVKSTIKSDSEIYVFKDILIQKLDKHKKIDDYFLVKDVGYNYWSEGRGKKRGGSIGSRILYKGKKENSKDIPYLKGSNFNRYTIEEPTQFLRHNYEKYLDKDDTFRFTAEILEASPKLIYRQTSSSLIGTIETKKYHNDKTVHVILCKKGVDLDLKFVLGLFNSKLLNYYYSKSVSEEGRAFAQVKGINVKKLPFNIPSKQKQSEIIKYVDQLLKLNEDLKGEKLHTKIEQLKQRIDHSEEKINQLVYEIYELTPEEIKIVEGENS